MVDIALVAAVSNRDQVEVSGGRTPDVILASATKYFIVFLLPRPSRRDQVQELLHLVSWPSA